MYVHIVDWIDIGVGTICNSIQTLPGGFVPKSTQ